MNLDAYALRTIPWIRRGIVCRVWRIITFLLQLSFAKRFEVGPSISRSNTCTSENSQHVGNVILMRRWLPLPWSNRTSSPPTTLPPMNPPPGNSPPGSSSVSSSQLDFNAVYANHSDFVRRLLRGFGVRQHDVDDQSQNVFIAVAKNLYKFDQNKPISPWLYSICRKIASRYRHNAYFRRVMTVDVCTFWERASEAMNPEQRVAVEQEQHELDELLDSIDSDKRVVFVMYEMEELSCEQIANIVGVPLGTVHSRLDAARKAVMKAYLRREAKRKRGDYR